MRLSETSHVAHFEAPCFPHQELNQTSLKKLWNRVDTYKFKFIQQVFNHVCRWFSLKSIEICEILIEKIWKAPFVLGISRLITGEYYQISVHWELPDLMVAMRKVQLSPSHFPTERLVSHGQGSGAHVTGPTGGCFRIFFVRESWISDIEIRQNIQGFSGFGVKIRRFNMVWHKLMNIDKKWQKVEKSARTEGAEAW